MPKSVNKIKVIHMSVPKCGDGCCHEELIMIYVNKNNFSYYDEFLNGLDKASQYKIILQDVLKSLKVDFSIELKKW